LRSSWGHSAGRLSTSNWTSLIGAQASKQGSLGASLKYAQAFCQCQTLSQLHLPGQHHLGEASRSDRVPKSLALTSKGFSNNVGRDEHHTNANTQMTETQMHNDLKM
jgi:hypothetical protein